MITAWWLLRRARDYINEDADLGDVVIYTVTFWVLFLVWITKWS